ncbi:MAG TPA: porin, partial [Nannocystis sp.]
PVAPAPQADPAPVPPPVSVAPASAPAATTASPAAAPSRFVPPTDAARLAEAPVDGGKARWRPGVGIEVSSADGRFSLQFNALSQLQAVAHFTPEIPGMDGGEATAAKNDFNLVFRRARLVFGGNLFSKNIKYKIQLTASPIELGWRSGTITRSPILDWYFTFDRLRDATFQVGQYKVPYNHQRMLRVTGMQFVDRSAANNEFTMDRDIGLDIRSKDVGGLGKLRYYAGVYLGDGIALHGPSDFGLAYVGRVEVLPFGQYDDLEEGDHDRLTRPRMLIGGAFAYIDKDPHDQHGFGGQIPADGRKASTLNATADMNFRYAGFSFEGAFFWRKAVKMTPVTVLNTMGNPVAAVAPRDGLGYFLQAGYLLPRLPLELGARWGQVRGQGDATSLKDQNEVGGVFNYFFARHWLKLQLDYLHLWNNEIRYGTDQVRLQLQAMF